MIEKKEYISPQEVHQRIRDTYPKPSEHAFTVWSDGSGHNSGHAASSAVVRNNASGVTEARLSACYAQNTHRAEFEGLLLGLHCVLEMGGWDTEESKSRLDKITNKPRVCWYTDNESLALSVFRMPDTSEPYYRRKSSGDLWARFFYYERALLITPLYIPRNSLPEHALADRMASEASLMLKGYLEVINLENNLLNEKESKKS